jgi:hypothetical protein
LLVFLALVLVPQLASPVPEPVLALALALVPQPPVFLVQAVVSQPSYSQR